jgi:hypothetical protein
VERWIGSGLRVVMEVDGQSVRGESSKVSGLAGAVWETELPKPFEAVKLDAAVRRGFSSAAPDWSATVGCTVRVTW